MEVLLNSVWGLLALAALLAWRRHDRQAGAGHAQRFVALVCMLLLMFPVISATDDLHPVAQAIEDSSKRSHKAWTTVKSHATYVPHSGPLVVTSTFFVLLPASLVLDELPPTPALSAQTRLKTSDLLRAPPSPLLS